MQFNETVKEVLLVGNSVVPVRVWFQPSGEPVGPLEIVVNSRGVVLPGVGAIDWRVLYGGVWLTGVPFSDTATHGGGVSQANGSFALNAEVATIIHNDTAIFPTNSRRTVYNADGTPNRKGWGGFPIVAQFVNNSAFDVRLAVTFITRSIAIP